MVIKTVIMLLVYSVPLIVLMFGLISSPAIAVLLYSVSGIGIAGIGMGIMHDANHGAYTNNSKLGNLLGHSLDVMGCSSALWKLQHNVLHHTFTNVHDHDEDITPPMPLLRFSPHTEKLKAHRFQHIYVWFFYSILTLYWVTGKDFKKASVYFEKGLIPSKKQYQIRLVKLVILKLLYFTYALVIPVLMAPFSAGWIIGGFILMHLLAGLLLSVIFQLAHVVPEMQFPQADDNGNIEENWYIHQLRTTSNFSPKNKLLFWYLGGLTNQIEHHLFPNICHVHYRKLSKLVEQTATEFNIPYNVNATFIGAVNQHIKTLKFLGSC